MRVLSANGLRVFGQGAQPAGAPASVFAVRQLDIAGFIVDAHGFRRSAAAANRSPVRVGSAPQSSPVPARAAAGGAAPQSSASRNPPPPAPSGEVMTRPLGSVPLPQPSAIAETFAQPVRNPAGGGRPAPAAPDSIRALPGLRSDVRQVLAMHRALHKFWDKYRVVLSDAWLKMQQQVRRAQCTRTLSHNASHVTHTLTQRVTRHAGAAQLLDHRASTGAREPPVSFFHQRQGSARGRAAASVALSRDLH